MATPKEIKKLRAERKEVIRVASVNESGTKIEHLANLMLIDGFNRRVREAKAKQQKEQ